MIQNINKLIETFSGHNCNVISVKYAPNNEFIVSGDNSGDIFLWKRGIPKKFFF